MTKTKKPSVMWRSSRGTEQRIEDALMFLVGALTAQPRRGKKAVVLHSLRVGYRLLDLGYGSDVVVAGLLHDILEKTQLTEADIARMFGPRISALVGCVTKDYRIAEPLQRYADTVRRCAAYGGPALAIRAVDLIDNCDRLTALACFDRLQRVGNKLELVETAGRQQGMAKRLITGIGRRRKALIAHFCEFEDGVSIAVSASSSSLATPRPEVSGSSRSVDKFTVVREPNAGTTAGFRRSSKNSSSALRGV